MVVMDEHDAPPRRQRSQALGGILIALVNIMRLSLSRIFQPVQFTYAILAVSVATR